MFMLIRIVYNIALNIITLSVVILPFEEGIIRFAGLLEQEEKEEQEED